MVIIPVIESGLDAAAVAAESRGPGSGDWPGIAALFDVEASAPSSVQDLRLSAIFVGRL